MSSTHNMSFNVMCLYGSQLGKTKKPIQETSCFSQFPTASFHYFDIQN